jgi:hypothetical protein
MVIFNIYGDLVYFMPICYILCSLATFFLVWVSCTTKNLATLMREHFEAGVGKGRISSSEFFYTIEFENCYSDPPKG